MASDKEKQKDNDAFMEFRSVAFGLNGTISKSFAEEQGNALFEAFMVKFDAAAPTDDPILVSARKKLKSNAMKKRYHDYEGDLMKLGLVMDLERAGMSELAQAVKNGEYDF